MVITKADLRFGNKDIPIPRKGEINKMLVRRTTEFIVILRWKIMAFLYPKRFNK